MKAKPTLFKTSRRVEKLTYAIREFVPMARELERKGRKVIYLNIGDPLKYDFKLPSHVGEALYKAVKEGCNYYSPSEGDPELREAIAEKEKKFNSVDIEPEDIVVTHGVSEAINFTLSALIDEGDEALIPEPTYPLYINYVNFYGGKPVPYSCDEENGWQPKIEDLEKKVTGKTRVIVIINPNNPTGALYDEKTVKRVLEIASENNLIVASDEIYDRIILEGEFKSTASLTNETPVIGLNGFSKVYLMTGWRLGYLYIKDPTGMIKERFMEAVVNMARNRLSTVTPVQKAAVEAIKGPQNHLEEMIRKVRERRDYTYKRINEIEGLSSTKPKAAFYIFPKINAKGNWRNDKEFVKKLLLEENVLIVHGSGFGAHGENHFRAVLLPPLSILEEAFNRIEKFLEKNSLTN